MLVYFTNLIIVVLSVSAASKSKATATSRLFFTIAYTSMVLVAGLRDKSVGTDTGDYVKIFNKMITFNDAYSRGMQDQEHGFWILNWLLHFISDQYIVLMFALALIIVGCFQRAIISYSKHITISFFVFITMGFYTFFFNGARQGIAVAIYSLAIGALLERNFMKYLAIVLMASLFHRTAIVTLPVYFLFNRTNTIKENLIIMLLGCGVAFLFHDIIDMGSLIDARYKVYGTIGEGGGYLMAGFTVVLSLFFLSFKKWVQVDCEQYGLFLNMLLFGAMISVICALSKVNPSGILRFALYFNVSTIFLWPIVYRNLTAISSKILFIYTFAVGYLVFFVLTTQRFSNLLPYVINSSF